MSPSAAEGSTGAGRPLLELDDVTVRFGGVVAISHLALTVTTGSIFALIGPNGAGKTSTFNIITGVYQPADGQVRFAGRSLSSTTSPSASAGWSPSPTWP